MFVRLCCLLLLASGFIAAATQDFIRIRRPSAAGTWYPAEADKLRAAVQQYLSATPTEPIAGRVRALVLPHANYPNTGQMTGKAIRCLAKGAYDRVILITASHYARFSGCSIPGVHYYRTPLGDIRLDDEAIRQLSFNNLISRRAVHQGADRTRPNQRALLHEKEHAIEVVLPFLQEQLGEFVLVPLVVGEFLDFDNRHQTYAVNSVAKSLREIMDTRTLIVVTSHFTRYGYPYGYVPEMGPDGGRFNDDVFGNIRILDEVCFEYLTALDRRGFQKYFEITENPVDGRLPLEILVQLIPSGAQGKVLDYDTSGRINQSLKASVSYATVVFYDMPGSGLAGPLDQAQVP